VDGRGNCGADGKAREGERQDPGGGAGGGAPSFDSGLLRRMLESAMSKADRIGEAFGRYKKAAGARIAELSFALVFAHAENEILSGRLDAARGEASTDKLGPTIWTGTTGTSSGASTTSTTRTCRPDSAPSRTTSAGACSQPLRPSATARRSSARPRGGRAEGKSGRGAGRRGTGARPTATRRRAVRGARREALPERAPAA